MRLTNTRLLVADPAASFRFYRDVVGLRPVWGREGEDYASFADDSGNPTLDILERSAMTQVMGGAAEGMGGGFVLVFDVSSVDEAWARLTGRGAPAVSGPTDQPGWGIRVAHVRDPDGNLIEVYQKLPEERWDPALRAGEQP